MNVHPLIWAAIIGALGAVIAAIISKEKTVWSILAGMAIGIIVGIVISAAITKVLPKKQQPLVLHAPFAVTTYYYSSGWMGDGEKGTKYIKINTAYRGAKRPGDNDDTCIKINYQPNSKGWAGIYWQYPDSNWGDQLGRKIVGAKEIVFWARGDKGGEIVEFKAGGIKDPSKKYQDSFEISLGRVTLTNEWQRYRLDLTDQDLSNVIGAFAWVATGDANPAGLTFYLDNIRYK